MPKRLLAAIIVLLIIGMAVRSWLDSAYSENHTIIYPLLVLCFQYGSAIFLILGVLIVVICIVRFRQVGWLMPILGILVFLSVGAFGFFLTLPDLTHLASVRFNERVYHLLSDNRFEEDSIFVPTTYFVYQCDYSGISCRRVKRLFRDEYVTVSNGYMDAQRNHRKGEFFINPDDNALYAKIDEQIFPVDTSNTIKD